MVRDEERLLVASWGNIQGLEQCARWLIKVHGYLHKTVHNQGALELFQAGWYLADKYLGRNAFTYFDDYM